MTKIEESIDRGQNPLAVLGVTAEATGEEIRKAYLEKVKEFPPDRAPVEFERVRDAYKYLSDPKVRTGQMLRAVDPLAPLTSLLPAPGRVRRFVGSEPWLAAIKEPVRSRKPAKKKRGKR